MNHEVRVPDIEIVVAAGAWDVAVIAFYADPDIHSGFHVVSGIDEGCEVANVVEALQTAITCLLSGRWNTLDELGASSMQGGGEAPF